MAELLQIKDDKVPYELRDLILGGKCFVFIGSGASSLSYYSWPKLVNRLCEECGISRRVNKDSPAEELLEAAYEAKLSDNDAYFKFLGEHFGSMNSIPWLYHVLFSLPFDSYLTVNLDPLVAKTAQTARHKCTLPINAYPALYSRNVGKRSIHYLHGYIEEDSTPTEGQIVIAKDEFEHAYKADSNLMSFLVQTLENESILFIGCRLREPVMKRVFGLCEERQRHRQQIIVESGKSRSSPPEKYILLPEPVVFSESGEIDVDLSHKELYAQQALYHDLAIKPVWYKASSKHQDLENALEQLANFPPVQPAYGWGGIEDEA